MISIALANASMASWLRPPTVAAYSRRRNESSVSGAPPPGTIFLPVHDNADDHEGVVDCPFEFIDHMLGAAADDDRDCFGVLALRDIDHLIARDFLLFDKAGKAEIFCGDRVNAVDDVCSGCPGKVLGVALLYPADGKDTCFCQVVRVQHRQFPSGRRLRSL